MIDTTQAIDRFTFDIIVDAVMSVGFIIVFAILFCILTIKRKQSKQKKAKEKIYNLRLIPLLFLVAFCIKAFLLIPAFVDVHTDNIKVVEITQYKCYNSKMVLLRMGSARKVHFTTIQGERGLGYTVEDFDIPTKGNAATILYAEYSNYILDFALKQ